MTTGVLTQQDCYIIIQALRHDNDGYKDYAKPLPNWVKYCISRRANTIAHAKGVVTHNNPQLRSVGFYEGKGQNNG